MYIIFNQGLSLVALKIINSLSQAYAIGSNSIILYAKTKYGVQLCQ